MQKFFFPDGIIFKKGIKSMAFSIFSGKAQKSYLPLLREAGFCNTPQIKNLLFQQKCFLLPWDADEKTGGNQRPIRYSSGGAGEK